MYRFVRRDQGLFLVRPIREASTVFAFLDPRRVLMQIAGRGRSRGYGRPIFVALFGWPGLHPRQQARVDPEDATGGDGTAPCGPTIAADLHAGFFHTPRSSRSIGGRVETDLFRSSLSATNARWPFCFKIHGNRARRSPQGEYIASDWAAAGIANQPPRRG
jgi:hypothetical protein